MVAPSVGRGEGSLAQPSPPTHLSETVARYLEPGVEWLARFVIHHWLFIANLMLFLFILPPFLAPILEAAGLSLPARAIFLLYRPTCHQLPERSFFIEGHQVAICARCSAIYLAFWGIGLVYALWAAIRRGHVPAWPAPPLWAVGLAALPMLIDGLTQLFGFRTSTNELRTITGSLAGATAAALIYPYMHSGFRQARQVWEANQAKPRGLARPYKDD